MNKKTTNRTVSANAQIAGSIAAEKRTEGYTVTVKMTGSDSKRGTQPMFLIEWTR